MARNNIPPIPKARYKDMGHQRTNDAITNAVDVLAGRKGNGMSRAVLVQDLIDYNLVSRNRRNDGTISIDPVEPPDIDIPTEQVDPPTVPTNVKAEGAFTTIILTWDEPPFKGYSHSEVWRSSTNDLSTASIRDTPNWNVWSDPVDYESVYYYWVCHVNKNGDVSSPHTGATNGLIGKTQANIDSIIDDMEGKIGETSLDAALREKIDEPATLITAKVGGKHTNPITGAQSDVIGGFGLAYEGDSIDAAFLVNRFWIADASSEAAVAPFIVAKDTDGKMKVFIRDAMISTAYIQSLVTQKVVAEAIDSGTINSVTINSAYIKGGSIDIGTGSPAPFSVNSSGSVVAKDINAYGTMQSVPFTSGSTGWIIRRDGTCEFNKGTFRGTLDGADGNFTGTVQADKIVGDVVTAVAIETPPVTRVKRGTVYFGSARVVTARPYARTLSTTLSLSVTASSSGEFPPSASASARITVKGDFGELESVLVRASKGSGSSRDQTNTSVMTLTLQVPANKTGQAHFYLHQVSGDSVSSVGESSQLGAPSENNIWTPMLFKNGGDLAAGSQPMIYPSS